MRIQIASDIHLPHREHLHDVWHVEDFLDCTEAHLGQVDALVLAGDIGNPERPHFVDFLTECSNTYPLVFLVSGNHEAYGHSLEETDALIRQSIIKLPNVHYLQCGTYDVKETNLRILGCTLWSNVPPKAHHIVKQYLSDYRAIFSSTVHSRNITVAELNAVHLSHVAWLTKELERATADNKRVLVITHHLPTYDLIAPKYLTGAVSSLNSAFASSLESLITEPVKMWVCGHTHTAAQKTLNGVILLCNPTGYPEEEATADDELIVSV